MLQGDMNLVNPGSLEVKWMIEKVTPLPSSVAIWGQGPWCSPRLKCEWRSPSMLSMWYNQYKKGNQELHRSATYMFVFIFLLCVSDVFNTMWFSTTWIDLFLFRSRFPPKKIKARKTCKRKKSKVFWVTPFRWFFCRSGVRSNWQHRRFGEFSSPFCSSKIIYL